MRRLLVVIHFFGQEEAWRVGAWVGHPLWKWPPPSGTVGHGSWEVGERGSPERLQREAGGVFLIVPPWGTASFFRGGGLKQVVITDCKVFTVSKERPATFNSWQQLSSLGAVTKFLLSGVAASIPPVWGELNGLLLVWGFAQDWVNQKEGERFVWSQS